MLLIAITLVVALACGAAAAGVARRHPTLDPATPRAAAVPARAVERELERDGRIARLLRERLDPRQATSLLLTVAVAVIVVLGILVYQVRSGSGIVAIDHTIEHWADAHATPTSHDVLSLITDLGATLVVVVVGLVVAVVEQRRLESRNLFLYLALVIGGQWVIAQLVKLGVGRTRPVLGIAAGLDGSFPSGHSASSSATYAAVAVVVGMARSRRVQVALTGAAVAIARAVASSRVLLGLHWFSDVLGGLALGWAWFAIVTLAFGGRLLRFGAPVELAERHEALRESTEEPERPTTRAAGSPMMSVGDQRAAARPSAAPPATQDPRLRYRPPYPRRLR